jgi:hypothetical protein
MSEFNRKLLLATYHLYLKEIVKIDKSLIGGVPRTQAARNTSGKKHKRQLSKIRKKTAADFLFFKKKYGCNSIVFTFILDAFT